MGNARSWTNVFRSIGMLVAAAVVMLCSSLVFSLPKWSVFDRNQFAFLPATWFAAQLGTVIDPSRTCLLIGASVVREGFDSTKLKLGAVDIDFVNLATTGGWSPMDVIDIQSSLLIDTKQRYRCVIVGMDNFYMRDFTPDAYELVTSNYISRLPMHSLLSMIRPSQGVSQLKHIFAQSILPFGRYSTDAQRWWRYGIYLARRQIAPGTNLVGYELFTGELTPAVQFMYDAMTPQFEKSKAQTAGAIVKFDLENPASFEHPGPAVAFVKSIARLRKLTDEIIIVRMPLTSVYRAVEAAAEPSFLRVLKSVEVAQFVDCKIDHDEEAYYFDTAHLNPVGRDLLSRSVGKAIRSILADGGHSVKESGICRLASLS